MVNRTTGLEVLLGETQDGETRHISAAELTNFLPPRAKIDENAVIREVRAWVRQRIATGDAGRA
jgi:hypothetical protein